MPIDLEMNVVKFTDSLRSIPDCFNPKENRKVVLARCLADYILLPFKPSEYHKETITPSQFLVRASGYITKIKEGLVDADFRLMNLPLDSYNDLKAQLFWIAEQANPEFGRATRAAYKGDLGRRC